MRATGSNGPAPQQTSYPPASVAFRNVLLAIVDTNPYLGDGSRQALATAAAISRKEPDGRVTVLVVDKEKASEDSTKVKMETVTWHLRDQQSGPFEVLEASQESCAAALIGDMVDQIKADVVLLSSETVHTKAVDANLLAEFVSCPVLLLP